MSDKTEDGRNDEGRVPSNEDQKKTAVGLAIGWVLDTLVFPVVVKIIKRIIPHD